MQRDNHVNTWGADSPEEKLQERPHCMKNFYNLIQ